MVGMEQRRIELFDGLYYGHHRAVHAFFLARTNHGPTALDLLQETFLKVWRHIDKAQAMTGDERRYWLFRIAKNTLIEFYRKKERRRAVSEPVEDLEHVPAATLPDPSDEVLAKEEYRLVDDAIRRLPEALRVPLVMQVVGGMTSSEIGQLLDERPGTIRYRIFKARQQLARELRLDAGGAEEQSI